MAEGGENPGKDDNDSGINNKMQNAETSDEEDHGTQKQLVAAIQCTDKNKTLKNGQEDEDPPTLTTGGTLPFEAAEGTNGDDQERKRNTKMKILKWNSNHLKSLMHKKNKVTDEMLQLISLIEKQTQEMGHMLNRGTRKTAETLSTAAIPRDPSQDL